MPHSSSNQKDIQTETNDIDAVSPIGNHRAERWLYPSLVLASFLLGIITGYITWGHSFSQSISKIQPLVSASTAGYGNDFDLGTLTEQINPSDGYALPLRYGNLGPRLLESGMIDYDAFAAIYANSGNPLTPKEIEILKNGRNDQIVITQANAHFLLNFFWAVGLVNKNSILTEGPIVQYSDGQIDRFASTGGWTLATKPITELYASLDLIPLTSEQQARVEEVASAVYRPCCDNSTFFPDCNHGMAMLGLLELMASQGSSVDEMFQAAKYVNAFWFPQQTLETAIYLKANQGLDFAQADARLSTSKEFSSGSGFGLVHKELQVSGLLPQAPGRSGSCAN